MKPIDSEFNAVVLAMVHKLMPQGFRISAQQTADYESLVREYESNNLLTINTGFSENTIFGSEFVNWSFRAWHDFCHVTGGFDFSPNGEQGAAAMQQKQLKEAYPNNPKLTLWLNLVDIEVNEQMNYFLACNDFPVNQYQFAKSHLAKKGYAL